MPTRIAHLSDLHYGGGFDIATWRAVENAVAAFNPDLLIVSGDLVDDPRRDHLSAAKKELDDLATRVGAELHVVPGNHDVFFSGVNLIRSRRSGLFYKIFDRTAPRVTTVGFLRPGGRWKTLVDRVKVFCAWGPHSVRPPQPPVPPPDGIAATMLREPREAGVLLALIDSNAVNQPIRIATGSVSTDDLVSLDAELSSLSARLQNSEVAHLARIAVIHHHVMPIAYTAGGIIGAEPFMVLHTPEMCSGYWRSTSLTWCCTVTNTAHSSRGSICRRIQLKVIRSRLRLLAVPRCRRLIIPKATVSISLQFKTTAASMWKAYITVQVARRTAKVEGARPSRSTRRASRARSGVHLSGHARDIRSFAGNGFIISRSASSVISRFIITQKVCGLFGAMASIGDGRTPLAFRRTGISLRTCS
jgi:hypothetical protein